MTNASSTCGLAIFLSSWITFQICLVMSLHGISRQRLMIRMDISTSKFAQIPKNSSVFPGGVIISPFVPYLLDGREALFLYHNLLSPPLRVLWVYLYRSISVIDKWARYSRPVLQFTNHAASSLCQQLLSCCRFVSARYFGWMTLI